MENYKKQLSKTSFGVRFNSILQLVLRVARDMLLLKAYISLMKMSRTIYTNSEGIVGYDFDGFKAGLGFFVITATILYVIRGFKRRSFRPRDAAYLDVKVHQERYSGLFLNNYLEISRFGPIEGAWFFFWIHSFVMMFMAYANGNPETFTRSPLTTYLLMIVGSILERSIQLFLGKGIRRHLIPFLDPASKYAQDSEAMKAFYKEFKVVGYNQYNTLRAAFYDYGNHNPQLHFYRSAFTLYDRKLKQTATISFYGRPSYDNFELERYGFANTRQGKYMQKENIKTV